jgi:hypothetical protein
MPYRRLPNTDNARLRALRKALALGSETPPHKLAFSPRTLLRAQKFLPLFEESIKHQRQFLASSARKVKNYDEIVRKARIYLTHFIRVMNMAIYRGELPSQIRAYYGLPTNELSVPSLNTENELVSWGRRIIDGEDIRIKKGGTPITNPTIAVVKVRYEQFLEAFHASRALSDKASAVAQKTSELRKEADDIILNIWNEVEKYFSNLPAGLRREKCEEYGVIYYLRKGELAETNTVQNSLHITT